MKGATRIIGIGSTGPGDDAAGIEVVRRLRQTLLPPRVEVHESTDPADLLQLAAGCARVIIVDAVVHAGEPGQVVELAIESLDQGPRRLLTSHGLGVARVLALCRMLCPNEIAGEIRVIGITIGQPVPGRSSMSSEVKLAVRDAAMYLRCLLAVPKAQAWLLDRHRR